jgi:hypothetical protein
MRNLLMAVIFLLGCTAFAQQKTPTAAFEVESHDFGKINESDGPATFKFSFRNTGAEPLILNSVHASCGCTTPSYSKEPVLPGAKGFIDVTYNPQSRPGHFNKDITVTTNGDPETIVLKISGEVIPSVSSSDNSYQFTIDGLKLKSNQITFAPIYFGQKQTQQLEIYNDNDKPVAIDFSEVPKHIQIKANPKILKPKEKGIIEATYDSKIKNDWDFVTDRIGVGVNGSFSTSNKISIVAMIVEDFSSMTDEQKRNGPKVDFANSLLEFGTIKLGDKITHDFVFTNNGKTSLIIRKVSAMCSCTAAEPKLKVIKPGESSVITLTYNSTGQRPGPVNKGIKVITNDPVNPITNIQIRGFIEVPRSNTNQGSNGN